MVVAAGVISAALIAATAGRAAADGPAPELLKSPFSASDAKAKQHEWAKYLKRQVVETNSIGMKLTLIPPGEFLMGSPKSENGRFDNEKQHRVRITKPFYMGVYNVTLSDYFTFYHASGYKTEAVLDGKGGWGVDSDGKFAQKPEFTFWNWGKTQTNEHPVVNVSWNDAVAFCDWLSKKKEAKKYRLPTEAEWEYACRAGTTTAFDCGDSLSSNDANFNGNFPYGGAAKGPSVENTTPVGSYRPNVFGLYDMHGNVWQWCQDRFDSEYYSDSPTDDPQGPAAGSSRVIRGGGWYDLAVNCRSANRDLDRPTATSTSAFVW